MSLQGIEREYEELDTVWFMAGSLFKNYPYDIPTDAFPLSLFKQVATPPYHLHAIQSKPIFRYINGRADTSMAWRSILLYHSKWEIPSYRAEFLSVMRNWYP